ncbi:Late embryogenesis abundant protein, LEA-14 [Artemisia annua]|uniref:Late embryogenesis abundant protein, LEA-14 n=1 Tax=Artemisia annua TaxID=35608 RepID=A0A2U1N7Y6_ARTAN|nr:Late embryogenesis abundant protein, LEA-14 [Artemisia annua]
MWLILRPQVPQFRVQSFTLSNFNESNNLVTGNWDASLDVRNPNDKIVLYYDHLEAAVFYKGESIAVTTVAPFMQGKKNETSVKASFAALNAYVNNGNGIKGSGGSVVEFNLRMVARVRFKAGAWWARRRILRIYCPDLNLPVGGVGLLMILTPLLISYTCKYCHLKQYRLYLSIIEGLLFNHFHHFENASRLYYEHYLLPDPLNMLHNLWLNMHRVGLGTIYRGELTLLPKKE